jgi:hypothetical protein
MLFSTKLLTKGNYARYSLKLFGIFSGVIILFTTLSALTIDLSYDGQGYHQATILALDKGWNPLYEKVQDVKGFKSENTLWVESYPDANAILALNLFKVTGNVETGKAISLLLITLSAALGSLALLELKVNKWLAGILLTVVIFNPVNLMQVFTLGLDSQFYSILIIFLSLGALIYKKFHPHLSLIGLSIATILLINNKLTSVAYALIFSLFVTICLLWSHKYRLFLKTSAALLLSAAIALGAYGYHPFVTNYLDHKSAFYPVYVSRDTNDKAYNFYENRPSNFVKENQATLFFKSIFFKTNGYFRAPKDAAQYKVPFTFSSSESNAFIFLGPKEGGFGVLFSGIVILLAGLIFSMLALRKKFNGKKAEVIFVSVSLLWLIASCIINPLNNAYRYIPQFWLVIPLILWLSLRFRHRLIISLNVLIFFLIFMNSIMIFHTVAAYNISRSLQLRSQLHRLSEASKKETLIVNFSQSEGNEFLLDRYKVKYEADPRRSSSFKCPQGLSKEHLLNNIGNSTALVCLNKEHT